MSKTVSEHWFRMNCIGLPEGTIYQGRVIALSGAQNEPLVGVKIVRVTSESKLLQTLREPCAGNTTTV